MNKGIVMEITEKNLIVMRPDGKFDRVPRRKRSCEIGEEIVYAEESGGWRTPSAAARSAMAAAVIFCIVLFASWGGKLGSPDVVAYVSMDINPSIEMGIDIEENVLELRGLNEDGNALIENVDYQGKKLENVTDVLLDRAEKKPLATGEAEIVIASTVVGTNPAMNDEAIAEKVKQQVTKHIEAVHPDQTQTYQVAAFAAPQEVREEAAKNGVSAGKYTVYLNAKNNGTDVTLQELREKSVLRISKEKPEVAEVIKKDRLPTKEAMKELVKEEKAGRLDKKLQEQKEKQTGGNKNGTSAKPASGGKNDKDDDGDDEKKSNNSSNSHSKKPESSGSSNVPGVNKQTQSGRDDEKKNGGAKNGAGSSSGKTSGKSDDKDKDKEKDGAGRSKEDAKKEEERRKEEAAERSEEWKKKQEEQRKKAEEAKEQVEDALKKKQEEARKELERQKEEQKQRDELKKKEEEQTKKEEQKKKEEQEKKESKKNEEKPKKDQREKDES
ncbi:MULTISPECIES: anti-sigma factor domain-containing protein [Paenibacillus]|uniref:anti-sigma factor domain-containing protein n=1 Tax=Paenibacillus TaxID=44249 RepID=UPI0022B8CF5E|nr:anti-sigma factor domain-containing protein [Paenibacillus caseinilyticus]MCZ8523823.1 anti-sigma factor domain-containing protein [Paenibacillus caseinilyticus]